jgi:hypothetical protein
MVLLLVPVVLVLLLLLAVPVPVAAAVIVAAVALLLEVVLFKARLNLSKWFFFMPTAGPRSKASSATNP